jgi:cell division protein FtsL
VTALARSKPAWKPDATPRRRRRHLRVVRPVSRRRFRRRLAAWIVVLTVIGTVFGIVVVHVRIAQTAFVLDAAEGTLDAERESNRHLRLQLAYLEAPERVRRAAVEKLGMVPPQTVHYVEVEEVDDPGRDGTGPGA